MRILTYSISITMHHRRAKLSVGNNFTFYVTVKTMVNEGNMLNGYKFDDDI